MKYLILYKIYIEIVYSQYTFEDNGKIDDTNIINTTVTTVKVIWLC